MAIEIGGLNDAQPKPEDNDQAFHFLRHHLCLTLKNEYMAEKSVLALWTALKKQVREAKVHHSSSSRVGMDQTEVCRL